MFQLKCVLSAPLICVIKLLFCLLSIAATKVFLTEDIKSTRQAPTPVKHVFILSFLQLTSQRITLVQFHHPRLKRTIETVLIIHCILVVIQSGKCIMGRGRVFITHPKLGKLILKFDKYHQLLFIYVNNTH